MAVPFILDLLLTVLFGLVSLNSVGHILTTLHTPKKIFVLPIDSSKVSFFRADLMGRGFRETILPPRAPEGPLRAPKGPQVRI